MGEARSAAWLDMASRAFLAEAGWDRAASVPLAGDASARSFLRLTRADGSRAVLMRAPADGSTERFAALADHFRGHGLSAPAILAADLLGGRLLLEDLGDASLARCSAADPAAEPLVYAAAVDLLAALRGAPPPAWLPAPGPTALAAMTEPAATWYRGAGIVDDGPAESLAEALRAPLDAVVARQAPVIAHRDFHAENLMWLPARRGVARIGLLDFQDAIAAPPAYDLASLIRDARRDLAPGLADALAERYAAASATAPADLAHDLAVLSAQRNLRILGIFARLSLRDGKPRYVGLIPRVWRHLQADLAHPALAALRRRVAALLPAPDPAHLRRLAAATDA